MKTKLIFYLNLMVNKLWIFKFQDVWAYRAVGIPIMRIFTINHKGELKHELTQTFQSRYDAHVLTLLEIIMVAFWCMDGIWFNFKQIIWLNRWIIWCTYKCKYNLAWGWTGNIYLFKHVLLQINRNCFTFFFASDARHKFITLVLF